jgi:WD40 repeat protein
VWDFNSGERLYSVGLQGSGFSILPYTTNDGGMRILVGADTNPYVVEVIDHATRRHVGFFPDEHQNSITHIFEVSMPDKTVFVTTSNDGTIKLWSREDFSLLDTIVLEKGIDTLSYPGNFIWGAVPYYHPDGQTMLVVTHRSGRILLYDLTAKTCVHSVLIECDTPDNPVAPISLDTYTTAGSEGGEDRLVVGTDNGHVRLYALPGLDFLRVLADGEIPARCVHVFDAPSDGRCLVAAGFDLPVVYIADTGDYRVPRADRARQCAVRSALKTG